MTGRLLLLLLLAPVFALARTDAPSGFDRKQALSVSQAAIGRPIGDLVFHHADGAVTLAELRGKPLVISLIYSSCYHTCPVTTSYLQDVVGIAREALGESSFNVVTIGFDVANDTPSRMARFARRHGIGQPGWLFLGGDNSSIQALTTAVGFQYYASPRGFDHLVQATIVDADGIVYRQVYGETFEAPALVEPLKQLLISGRTKPAPLAEWINDVRLFCTIYDPSSGRYQFDYSVLVLIAVGGLCLSGLAVWLVQAWRQANRAQATGRAAGARANSRERLS